MRFLVLITAISISGCGAASKPPVLQVDEADIVGSVQGVTLGRAQVAYLKSSFDYIVMGDNLIGPDRCLRVAEAAQFPSIGFGGQVTSGRFEIGSFVDADQSGSGAFGQLDWHGGPHATGGFVEISEEEGVFAGTFQIIFAKGELTGEFRASTTPSTVACQ
jgi:hypothetical protein